MKKILVFCFIVFAFKTFSQNVGINSSAATPDPSAMLDVVATNKGVLIPRVSLTSTTDVSTIPSPQTSLLVYNTNTGMTGGGAGFYYYDGSAWRLVSGGGGSMVWNTGISSANGVTSWAGNQTAYPHNPGGSLTVEAPCQLKVSKMLMTRLRVYVGSNTLNSASTIAVRKNGVTQTLSLSIPATTTGFIEATGAVSFSDGDLLSIQAIYGGTALQAIAFYSIELEYY